MDQIKTRKLYNVFDVDGLNAINDAGIFGSNFRKIYQEELELYRENDNIAKSVFLDLHNKIKNDKFQIGFFDKGDSFPYGIIRMPETFSNIQSYMFYMSVGGGYLTKARV